MSTSGNDEQLTSEQRDFLKLEYQAFTDSLEKNEASAEQRLNFYVGLITAAAAALGFVGKTDDGFNWQAVRPIGIALGSMLTVLGVLLVLRAQKRDRRTDELRRTLGAIRKKFGVTDHMLVGPSERGWFNGSSRTIFSCLTAFCFLTVVLLCFV
jgi:hypothetical protein